MDQSFYSLRKEIVIYFGINTKIWIDRTPKQSVGGSEDGEEGDVDKDEDEDSVMTIDGVEGGYVWL